LQWIQEK
jgi:hypothetical protein